MLRSLRLRLLILFLLLGAGNAAAQAIDPQKRESEWNSIKLGDTKKKPAEPQKKGPAEPQKKGNDK